MLNANLSDRLTYMFLALLTCLAAPQLRASPSDWPQFQYDAQHTGYNPHANVQPGLELKFQRQLADKQLKPVTICNGLAITAACTGPRLGYDTIYCYNAETGVDVWVDSIGPWIRGLGQVVAANGMWFIQAKRELDGLIEARDQSTGEIAWTDSHKLCYHECLAPVMFDSLLLFESGTYGGCRVLNAFTGKFRWWQWWYQIAAWSPTIFRDSVYAYLNDRFIGSAVAGQQKVDIVSYVLADAPCPVNTSTAEKTLLYDAFTSVVFDTATAVALYCERVGLWAFDMNSREYLWQKCDTNAFWRHSQHLPQPAVKDSLVFMPSMGGLHVYHILTGDEVWSFDDSGYFSYPPVITDDYVFVSGEHNTYMIDLETHEKVWEYPAGGYLSVANDMLYIGGYLGEVYAFGPTPTEVTEDPEQPIPSDYALAQNYPNPFNPSTTIEFALPQQSHVRLSIYNVLGQEVVTLVNGPLPAGTHSRQWLGRDVIGSPVSSGIYFYRLQAADRSLSRKMIVLK